jgi:hypothetical protein
VGFVVNSELSKYTHAAAVAYRPTSTAWIVNCELRRTGPRNWLHCKESTKSPSAVSSRNHHLVTSKFCDQPGIKLWMASVRLHTWHIYDSVS